MAAVYSRCGRLHLLLLSGILLLGLSGCDAYNQNVLRGSGEAVTEERDVESFSAVVFSTGGELILEQSGEPELSVTADDNILPHLRTEVRDGTLHIDVADNQRVRPSSDLIFRVHTPELRSISIRGSGNVRMGEVESGELSLAIAGSGNLRTGAIAAGRLELEIDGSGDILVEDVQTDKLDVEIAGSGSVEANGRAQMQNVSIGGSGSFDGSDLQGRRGVVSIEGSGDAAVNVSEVLEADIEGSGDVAYGGDPKVTQRIAGSGSVSASHGR